MHKSSTLLALALFCATTCSAPAFAQNTATATAPAATTAVAPNPEFENALSAYYKGQWQEASDLFGKILQRDPRDSMALDYWIYSYYKRNDLHTVLYEVEQKAVATDNKDAVALAHLGFGYMARSMREPQFLDEAQKVFEKALEIDKNLSIAHTGLGLVYYERRMMPRAKGHFVAALRDNPNDLMALERLGDITMVDEKRPQQALEFFEQLQQRAPDYPDGYWYVGSAYYDMQQYEKTLSNLQKCEELDPNGYTQGYHAPMLMGKTYLKMKDYDDAKKSFQRALQLNPNNPEAKYYLEHAAQEGAPAPAPSNDGGDTNKKKKK
jgi:superkiller protein 3